MSLLKTIDFSQLGDERGSLISLEANKQIPFAIKRVYYIYGTEKEIARGFHAHKQLQQVAVCVAGKCRMILDDGKKREEIRLINRRYGLARDARF